MHDKSAGSQFDKRVPGCLDTWEARRIATPARLKWHRELGGEGGPCPTARECEAFNAGFAAAVSTPSAGVALNSELKCRDGRPLLKELANIVAFLDSEQAHPSARIIEDVATFLGSLSGKYDRFDAGRQVEEPSEEYVLRLLGRIGHLERQLRDAEALIRTPRSATERRDWEAKYKTDLHNFMAMEKWLEARHPEILDEWDSATVGPTVDKP